MSRRISRWFLVPVVALMLLGLDSSTSATPPGEVAGVHGLRSAAPSVVCVPGYARNSRTAYRTRPRVCNFLMFGAPVIHLGMILSHATRWHQWGAEHASGTGRHFVNGGPPNGVPMKFWLANPKNICGKKVFSTLWVKTRKMTYRPNAKRKYIYGRWLPWGEKIDLAVCTR